MKENPAGWRRKKEDEKVLTMHPHPDPLPLVWLCRKPIENILI
jgi:hypothetical protein